MKKVPQQHIVEVSVCFNMDQILILGTEGERITYLADSTKLDHQGNKDNSSANGFVERNPQAFYVF
jgi:hypothetical protein